MKHFKNKLVTYGLTALLVAVVMVVGYGLNQKNKDATKACNSKALDFIEERSGERLSYPNEVRDADYDFAYTACMRSRGYDSDNQ